MPDHNVVAVGFADRANAFQALSELKGAALEGSVEVMAASVVLRDDSGRLQVPEGVDNVGGPAPWVAASPACSSASSADRSECCSGGPGACSSAAPTTRVEPSAGRACSPRSARPSPPGGTALVADVSEYTPEVIDVAMARLGGVLLRRDAEEVLAELEAAQQAYEQAQKDAKRLARKERKVERRADFEERKNTLKDKLGIS